MTGLPIDSALWFRPPHSINNDLSALRCGCDRSLPKGWERARGETEGSMAAESSSFGTRLALQLCASRAPSW
jgi:hypothetical protein